MRHGLILSLLDMKMLEKLAVVYLVSQMTLRGAHSVYLIWRPHNGLITCDDVFYKVKTAM